MLVGSRLLAQRHLRRRAPTSTPALAILDHPIPWSRLELLAALPVTATAIYALAGVTLASPDRLRARQQTLIWSQTATDGPASSPPSWPPAGPVAAG